MKKQLHIILIAILSVVLMPACISIKENIEFNEDGSGHFSLIFDMTELNAALKMMGEMNEESPADSPTAESPFALKELAFKMQTIPGVSKITIEEDDEKGFGRIGCNFLDIKALNKIMNTIFEEEEEFGDKVYFKYNGKVLQRLNAWDVRSEFDKMMQQEGLSSSEYGSFLSEGIKAMSYETNYILPRKVKSAKNNLSQIHDWNVKISYFPWDENKGGREHSIENKIKF